MSAFKTRSPYNREFRDRRAGKQASAKVLRAAATEIMRRGPARALDVRMAGPTSRSLGLAEVKYFDQSIVLPAVAPIWNAPVVYAAPSAAFTGMTVLNLIRQGSSAFTRIGNKVVIKSIDLKLMICCDDIAATAGVSCARICLIYDRQPNGAAPAITDVFYSDPAGALTAFSGLNMRNKSRFSIIRDQFVPTDPAGPSGTMVHLYCHGRWETEFKATTVGDDIGDIATGSILLFVYKTPSRDASSSVVVTAMDCRLRYFD